MGVLSITWGVHFSKSSILDWLGTIPAKTDFHIRPSKS